MPGLGSQPNGEAGGQIILEATDQDLRLCQEGPERDLQEKPEARVLGLVSLRLQTAHLTCGSWPISWPILEFRGSSSPKPSPTPAGQEEGWTIRRVLTLSASQARLRGVGRPLIRRLPPPWRIWFTCRVPSTEGHGDEQGAPGPLRRAWPALPGVGAGGGTWPRGPGL